MRVLSRERFNSCGRGATANEEAQGRLDRNSRMPSTSVYSGWAAASDALFPSEPLPRFLASAAVSLAGAAAFGGVSMAVETAAFRGYKFLERQGLIERLTPKETTVGGLEAGARHLLGSLSDTVRFVRWHRCIALHGDAAELASPRSVCRQQQHNCCCCCCCCCC